MKHTALLFATALVALTASADTLNFTGQPNNVEDGGQFSAYLSSDPAQELLVYCADYRNEVSIPGSYSVTVTDLVDIIGVTDNTRYGKTSAASFSTQTAPASIGDPQDRYAMAAWLIKQYDFSSGVTTADDQIQNAVWTLLDTNGAVFTDNGGTGTYLASAEAWLSGESDLALAEFEVGVVIYSSTDIASMKGTARYEDGTQEMIGFLPTCNTPEPSTAWFAVGGLALVLFAKARQNPKAREQ